MKRKRTKLAVPATPGGFLNNPPPDCPNVRVLQPDERYEKVRIVDYCLCNKKCRLDRVCERRLEEDSGRRQRINRQKNGGGGE